MRIAIVALALALLAPIATGDVHAAQPRRLAPGADRDRRGRDGRPPRHRRAPHDAGRPRSAPPTQTDAAPSPVVRPWLVTLDNVVQGHVAQGQGMQAYHAYRVERPRILRHLGTMNDDERAVLARIRTLGVEAAAEEIGQRVLVESFMEQHAPLPEPKKRPAKEPAPETVNPTGQYL